MAGGDGGEGRNECVMRYFGTQRGMWEHDTVFWGATRHATSLQRPWVAWYASMVEGAGDGRGNLREEPRRPRPYSRHCGEIVGGVLPSTFNGNGVNGDHDAARRVATSSEKRENRF